MSGARSYKQEQREKKTASYFYKIQTLMNRSTINPFEVDYTAELEKLFRDNPKDKGLILQAEREVYKAAK